MSDHDAAALAPAEAKARPSQVQLLVTCLVDLIVPRAGIAAVQVLERLGVTVECPEDQTCCGQPALNAGGAAEARALARHTIDVLWPTSGPIVVPSGSCADMVIHQYPALFADDPVYADRARAIAARTSEFSQFIVRVLGVTDVGAASTGRVAYHACCHGLRGLSVRDEPAALIGHVSGITTCPLAEQDVCCGFGGLFAVKMADVSSAMLARKLDCIEASGATTVVVTDVSCAMHMQGGLRRRRSVVEVRHLAELLADEGSGPDSGPKS